MQSHDYMSPEETVAYLERLIGENGSGLPTYEVEVLKRQLALLRDAMLKDMRTAEKLAEGFDLAS